MDVIEIKKLIEDQGKAWEEAKKTIGTIEADVKKFGDADVLTKQKLEKIEKSLDTALELKTKIEAGLEAERKEREDLEKRLNRKGGDSPASTAEAVAAEFRSQANMHHKKRGSTPIDEAFDAAKLQEYRTALNNVMRLGDSATDAERKLLQIGVDSDGGYLVPPDTSGRIVKKIYESSPIRQIANVTTTNRDKKEGIEDLDEAGAAYSGERTTSGNTTTPEVGKWDIPVWDIDTEPTATRNLLADADFNIEQWLDEKVTSKFARFENSEFCVGDHKIRGFTSYQVGLDAGSGVAWGTLGYIKTGANGAFNGTNPGDKILELVGLLKNEYLQNARFVTRRSVITLMRKFKDTAGNYLWQPSLILGQPETFDGYAITRAEDMPALADNGYSMAFGDFNEGYQIVDRPGITLIRDEVTAKPKIKFFTHKRTGGGVLNFEAIKLLQFAA